MRRSTRSLSHALAAAAGALLFAATPAHATAHSDGGPLELWHLELGATQVNTGNATFSGTGHYVGGAPATFSGMGHQIGAVNPWIFTFGLHPSVMVLHHLSIGASFEIGGGAADSMQDSLARSAQIGTNLTMVRGGADVGTVWGFGPVELRASVGSGVRSVSAPILSFEPSPCKGGRCFPSASAIQGYIQPRVAIDVVAGRMFTFGAYAGVDIVPDLAVTVGAFVAIHLPGWDHYARANEPAPEPAAPPPPPVPVTSLAPEIPLAEAAPTVIPDIPTVLSAPDPNAPQLAPVSEPELPAPQLVVPWRVHAHVDTANHTLTVTTPDGTVVTPLE